MTNLAKWSTCCLTVFHPDPLSLKPFKTRCLLVLPKFVYSSCSAADIRQHALRFFTIPTTLFWPLSAVIGSLRLKNKHMSGFSQYYGLVLNFSDRNIDYLVWYTVSLVLTVSVATDSRSLRIHFTDFNELITMFPVEINHIPLCIWHFPVSTAQTKNSLFSESNFHSPLRTSRFKSLLVCQNFHSPWRADEWNFPALSFH